MNTKIKEWLATAGWVIAILLIVLVGTLASRNLQVTPSGFKAIAQQTFKEVQVRFVVKVEEPTTWMEVRLYELGESPSSLEETRSTPFMTARDWSYTVTMRNDMYTVIWPLLYTGIAGQSAGGRGVCWVEVDGVEVPGSRTQIPSGSIVLAKCEYRVD